MAVKPIAIAWPEPEAAAATEATKTEEKPKAKAKKAKAKKSDAADDLKKIEGIGPKIASVLADEGVTTFAQLAEMSVDQVKETLKGKVRFPSSSVETWAEQAALAAAGKWDELDKLQDELQGGRR